MRSVRANNLQVSFGRCAEPWSAPDVPSRRVAFGDALADVEGLLRPSERLGDRADLVLVAEDAVPGDGLRAMEPSQARDLARLVFGLLAEAAGAPCALHLCCEGGVSRSAGAALAVASALGADDMGLWADGSIAPNEHVYALVRRALGSPVSELDLEARLSANVAAHRGVP